MYRLLCFTFPDQGRKLQAKEEDESDAPVDPPKVEEKLGAVPHDRLIQMSRRVKSVAAPSEAVAGFDEMVSRTHSMLGGKGGAGKTSCAASLAVKFANSEHPTLVVSTNLAHSLSDSFAQRSGVDLEEVDSKFFGEI